MISSRNRAFIFFVGFLALAIPFPARAQFLGYTAPQSVSQVLATNAACGSHQTIAVQNIGQTQHTVFVSFVGSPATAQITLQGSNDGTNWFTLGNELDSAISSTFNASGGAQLLRLNVSCATGATYSLSYYGSSIAASQPFQGAALISQIDRIPIDGASAGANNLLLFNPPFANMGGELLFSYSALGGPSGSTLSVFCDFQSLGNAGSGLQFTYSLASATGTQPFYVPPAPCAQETISYTSGGASSSTFSVEYLFLLPGMPNPLVSSGASLSSPFNLGPQLSEKGARWSLPASPTAGTQATVSKAAVSGVYHVADCVSFSASAATAPTATTLQINLRNGATGAGTVIWTQTVTLPANVGTHVTANFCGLNLITSVDTALTLEFSAGLTNESESVTLSGYDVQ